MLTCIGSVNDIDAAKLFHFFQIARNYAFFLESSRKIAEDLGRHRSTVDRETVRNGDGGACCWKKAREKASKHRSAASSKPRRTGLEQWSLVEEKPEPGWNPEQVSGRLRREGGPRGGRRPCLHLRRRGKKPNWKGGPVPNRTGNSERTRRRRVEKGADSQAIGRS